MLAKVKSLFTITGLFLQYNADNIYRVIFGMPRLKRCEITASLYLGSQYNLVGLRKLIALGITAIINMRIHSVYNEAQYKGVRYLHLPTTDNTPPIGGIATGRGFRRCGDKKWREGIHSLPAGAWARANHGDRLSPENRPNTGRRANAD